MNDTSKEVASTPLETKKPSSLLEKKRKKTWIIGAIIAGGLSIGIAGSVIGYSLWYQNPNKVVHDAIINAISATSSSFTGNATITTDIVDITISTSGIGNNVDGSYTTSAQFEFKKVDLDFTVDGELIAIGDTFYVKLDKVKEAFDKLLVASDTELADVPAYVTDIIAKVDGRWISVAPEDYRDFSKETSQQQKCLSAAGKQFQDNKDIQREVIDLYRKHQFIVIDEELGAKKIENISSAGYAIDVNNEKLVQFVRGLSSTALGESLSACDTSLNFDTTANRIARADRSSSDETRVELWVSQLSHEIQRVSISSTTDEMSLNAVFSISFNEPVWVKAPRDATSVSTIIKDIQAGYEEYAASREEDNYLDDYEYYDDYDEMYYDDINFELES